MGALPVGPMADHRHRRTTIGVLLVFFEAPPAPAVTGVWLRKPFEHLWAVGWEVKGFPFAQERLESDAACWLPSARLLDPAAEGTAEALWAIHQFEDVCAVGEELSSASPATIVGVAGGLAELLGILAGHSCTERLRTCGAWSGGTRRPSGCGDAEGRPCRWGRAYASARR